MKRDSERLDALLDPSVKALMVVLKPGEHTDDEWQAAKVAGSALATIAKFKQTERAADSVVLSIGERLAVDKEEFARYIERTMPHVPLPKPIVDHKKIAAPKA